MEFLGYILLAFFVGLILFVALTFGTALLVLCLAVTFFAAVWITLRQAWYRWRFLRAAQEKPPNVIEGDYEDISHHNKK